jgi:hypothetical protein
MTQSTQRPSHLAQHAGSLAASTALVRRQAVLERRHQEAMATAHQICHRSQLQRARRRVASERRHGHDPGPLAWFAVEGVIGDQVVRAVWADGRLRCDRLLESRARLLVDLGAEFGCDDVPRRYRASLQAPSAAVLLTLIRACDLATVIEVDIG